MRLAIIGGGGFRVPLVYQALTAGEPLIDEISLYDTSAARLAVIENVLSQLDQGQHPVRVRATTVLDESLAGADFVFSAMRVGGLRGRIADERAALGLGLIGQETTGPGGIAYALRTIPVTMHLARRVLAVAPAAYVVNFTNPAGVITEAMRDVLGDRVIGICDTPSGLGARLAGLFGVPQEEVRLDYAGLNHLGWLRAAHYRGRDLVAEALAADEALNLLEEAQILGADWIRTLGMIPNEYLYYYYCARESLRTATESTHTRGEFLRGQQDEFYRYAAAHPAEALAAWRRTREDRESSYMSEARPPGTARPAAADGGGGYERVALNLIRAIGIGRPATLVLNVRNGDTLAGLPADAVVEVPCTVGATGAHALAGTGFAGTGLGGAELGLVQQVKAVEQLTIRASLERDPSLALQALALHPLVDSVAIARELLAVYRRNEPALFD
jgi:6-phospho-beta-glucosidase